MSLRRAVTIHCAATPNGKGIRKLPEKINKWHRDRGFRKCGYHYIIDVHGQKYSRSNKLFMRGLNETGAHVKGYNRMKEVNGKGFINIGICLEGTDRFTKDQFQTLREILDSLFLNFDIRRWEIYHHNELSASKSCPGMRNANLLSWYHLQDYDAIEPYLLKEK